MKIGALKRLLNDLPDNMEVVLPGSDHTYRRVKTARRETAGMCRDGYIGEYHPDLPNGGGWGVPPDTVADVLVLD